MRWRHSVVAGPILAFSLALATVATSTSADGVSVHDAWIREMPPGMTIMAGYMALRNSASRPQVLVAASSPDFATVAMHRTTVNAEDGMAEMAHLQQIELAPSARLMFAPGGLHLMLMNPKRTLRSGDRVIINLEFRSGVVLPVEFSVRK